MHRKKRAKQKKPIKKISQAIKPQELSLEDWQIVLRRQSAQEGNIRIKNIGNDPIFSTFMVSNRETERTYRVVICGETLGVNYCSCPDFSVNTLGTCKHVEHVLCKLKRKKGAKKMLQAGYVSEHSAVTLRYGLNRRIAFYLGTSASDSLRKLVSRFFDGEGYLTPRGFEQFDKFAKQVKTLEDDVRYHEDAMRFIANVRDVVFRRNRVAKIFPDGTQDHALNRLLKTDLYPFQKEGVLFAVTAGRSLIADDMGLGKTVEAIAAAEIMNHCFGVEKVLIICPTSLKYQWQKEIERFTDRHSLLIQGLLPKRQMIYQEDSFFKITNYDVVHRDMAAIAGWAPDLIILDEAQRIKNWKTRLARSVKRLYSPYAIVLTGTPLENRLEELHSIVQFIDQHHLGPLFRFLHAHQVTDETGKVVGYRNLNELGKSLKPILIRRKKEEVLRQLPERVDKNYFVAMTPEQIDIHEDNRKIVIRLVNKWRHYKFLSEEDRQRLLRCLQNMRMVSDNTYLINQNTVFGNKINELEVQLQEIFEDKHAKVVIFSQWLRMLELVIAMLDTNNWKHVWLHGSVPSKKRGDLIKAFRDEPDCRVFLSTEAGGVGLNLQNAATVINLDLPWNPSKLEQRISRVHRLGQRHSVQVINFIAQGSIEQGILELLKFKRSMFSGVLDGGENEVFLGTTRFNRFMQTVETATESLPKEEEKPSLLESEKALEDTQTSREEISEDTREEEEVQKISPKESVLDRDAIKGFLQAGAFFLEQMSKQFDGQVKEGEDLSRKASPGGIKISKDQETGKQTLQIPLPDEKTMGKILQIGKTLLDIFKKE